MTPVEELEYEPRENVSYHLQAMDVDEDSDMEEIPVILPIASDVAPMTMREMAESVARRRGEATGTASDVEIINTDVQQRPSPSARASEGKSTPKIKVTRQSRASSSTPAVSKKGSARPRATRRASARKRGRDSETDEDIDGVESESLTSPKKRTKVAASSLTPAPSTRTLRPRASKTPAQIREEKEQEVAFRRATAS
jgi:xeroderma pigmentosum group C-complementing protein